MWVKVICFLVERLCSKTTPTKDSSSVRGLLKNVKQIEGADHRQKKTCQEVSKKYMDDPLKAPPISTPKTPNRNIVRFLNPTDGHQKGPAIGFRAVHQLGG